MFVQTQKTPNPNSLKFLPGRKVSNDGPYEILNKEEKWVVKEYKLDSYKSPRYYSRN